MNSTLLAEPILFGRDRELAELHRYLELAEKGKGTTVFISGEAGSGKTRLVSEFLEQIKKKGALILTGWCLSNAAQPYFPFIEAFESYYATTETIGFQQQELKSWIFGHEQFEGREVNPQVWKDKTFAAITKELLVMSTNKPIILFIDDVHWADSASLAMVHYIARSITSERLLLIATFRNEEATRKPKKEPAPLAETLQLMAREDLFKEIKLKNLNQGNIERIAESMLGGSIDLHFLRKLSTESQGNPLFVVEALRMMHCQGALLHENGEWHLTNERIGIPPKVKDVIMRRLDSLRPSQRKILDLASVIGEKFDPKMIAEVLSQDSVDILQSLRNISQSSLIVSNENDYYRFEHAKIQEMLYQDIPLPLKKEFHSRIAVRLETKNQGSGDFPFTEVAYHYVQAGDKEKAIFYSLAAGRDALAKWSNVQAIEHFRYVLENASTRQTQEKSVALEGLGDAYAANCMYAEAIKKFDGLAASETGAVKLRALRKAMDAAFVKGDKPDLLLEYAKKAKEVACNDRLEMARILMNRGRAFAWAGSGEASKDIADYEAALQIFEEENSLPDMAEALARNGEVCAFHEDMQEKALGELLQSVALIKELGDSRKEIQTTLRVAYGFMHSGLFEEARCELFAVLKEGEKMGTFVELARAHGILSLLAEVEENYSDALFHTFKSLEYCEKIDVSWIKGMNFSMLTRLYGRLGDLKSADEYFNKLKRMPLNVLSSAMLNLYAPVTEAIYFAVHGRWQESNAIFEKLRVSEWVGYEKIYAWALEQQGKTEESKAHQLNAQKMHEESAERFTHANLQTSILMPRIVDVGGEVEVRINLVNVARIPGMLVRIERLLPSDCTIVSMPTFCSAENDAILIAGKSIRAFGVESIKLKVSFKKVGTFHLNPCLVYVNDLGETITRKTRPVTLRVQFGTSEQKQESNGALFQTKLEFKSQAAEKAFDYLVSAFKEDYLSHRLLNENCGWRTLMEVVKGSRVTMYSIYGRSGRDGKAKLELEHLGAAESRFFQGERGRGGRVLKIRVRNENEIVRRRVDNPKTWH